MGRIVNHVLARNKLKASKLTQLVKQALRQIAKLNEEARAKYNAHLQAIRNLFLPYGPHLLKLSLRRCGNMIEIENRLDAYTLIEQYLNLLMDRIDLLAYGRECPDELKEAASGLVFAATRCKKEIPQLENIMSILKSRFGNKFIGAAVELRNTSAINKQLGEKLSVLKPTADSKAILLNSINSQKGQLPLPNQEHTSGSKRKSSSNLYIEKMEDKSSIFGSEDAFNSTHSRKKFKGETSYTSSHQNDFEPSNLRITRQMSKDMILSPRAPNQASLESSSSIQTRRKSKGVDLNTSPKRTDFNLSNSMRMPTRQKNKGVALNTTSKGIGLNSFNPMQIISEKKVVPLNTSPSRTNLDPSNCTQTRRKDKGCVSPSPYRTRSSSHKS